MMNARPFFLTPAPTHMWARLLADFVRIAIAVFGGLLFVLMSPSNVSSCPDGVTGSQAEIVAYAAGCSDSLLPGTSVNVTPAGDKLAVHVHWLGLDDSVWTVVPKGERWAASVYWVESFDAAAKARTVVAFLAALLLGCGFMWATGPHGSGRGTYCLYSLDKRGVVLVPEASPAPDASAG